MEIEWINVNKNTYITKIGYCTVGRYMLNENEAVLIDSGSSFSEDLISYFSKRNMHVAAIFSTHIHVDHIANHKALQDIFGCPIYAGDGEISSRTNPHTFSVTPVPSRQAFDISGKEFTVIPTPGHSIDHMAYVTPDGVCFVGDAFISKHLVERAKLPYFFNTSTGLSSMEKLKRTSYEYYVLAHNGFVKGEDLPDLVNSNIKKEQEIYDYICEIVTSPTELYTFYDKFFKLQNIKVENLFYYSVHTETLLGRILDLCSQGRLKLECSVLSK